MADNQERHDNRRDNRDRSDNYNRRDNGRRYNNDRPYESGRQERRNEEKNEEVKKDNDVDNRNIAVDLRTNIAKSVSGIGDLDSKKTQILSDLDDINGLLVEFYDEQLNSFGAQGLRDSQGRRYSSANYSTPEEKLVALEGIVFYNIENKSKFEKAHSKKVDWVKNQKQKLRTKAIKLLDDQKELIDKNKQLIKDAELDIEQDKEKSKQLEQSKLEEQNKSEVALKNQKFIEKKVEETKKEIEELRKIQADVSMEIKNAKEDDAAAQARGQKKNSPQAGYYNAKGKELENLTREIQQKENSISLFNDQILQYKDEYEKCKANISNISKQQADLAAITADKKRNLDTLKTKNSELKSKFNQAIIPLEEAFEKNIDGMYDDGIRLDYEKDSKLNKDTKDNQENTDVSDSNDEKETEDNASQQSQQSEGASNVNGGTLPLDVTEEELASNYVYHFTHSMSAAQRRQIVNGPGFEKLVNSMDSAGMLNRRHLRVALEDMKKDLEDTIPDRWDFIDRMSTILPSSDFDLDELYDTMFVEYDNGDISCSDFSKLDLDEIRKIQRALDHFSDLKFNGGLTVDQAQLFEDNFARYAKIGTLLQNDGFMNGRFGRPIRRLFRGAKYNANRKLLTSFSKYSESRFKDLNDQYEHLSDFKRSLGANVERTPKYTEQRGSVERTNRDLIHDVEDGKMNYR